MLYTHNQIETMPDSLINASDWICECGQSCKPNSGDWRWNGETWEHHHGYPMGHVPAMRKADYEKAVADALSQLTRKEDYDSDPYVAKLQKDIVSLAGRSFSEDAAIMFEDYSASRTAYGKIISAGNYDAQDKAFIDLRTKGLKFAEQVYMERMYSAAGKVWKE